MARFWQHGNPACWRWKVPTETEVARMREKLRRQQRRPDPYPYSDQEVRWFLMAKMNDNRCAICGRRCLRLRKDHCHETGLVRGWLCPSCNTSEGCNGSSEGIYAKYRAIHPALMCGVREEYVGGWGR